MNYDAIKKAAEGYKADMVKFLRDMIAIPSESCEEEGVVKRIAAEMEKLGFDKLPICVAKTQYSLSDNPALKGAPTGWRLHVRDCLFYGGAGLVVPVAGDISLMPGTGSRPAFRNVDVDLESGQVTGLF